MNKRINLFGILKNENKLSTLLVYSATQIQLDPYEKNTEKNFMNPLPIKALVRQISQESLRWKYYSMIPSKSIEVIAELKYETLFKTADKIKYNEEYYKCWKDDSQNFMITKRNDYILVILGIKND